MVRRKKIDVFFILFLCSIAAYVVTIREHSRIDEGLQLKMEEIVQHIIPKISMRFSADTIIVPVDADSVGTVLPVSGPFTVIGVCDDIGPDDSISVTLTALTHNNVLVSTDIASVGHRTGSGAIDDRRVSFPVTCRFPSTGIYRFQFEMRSDRVHQGENNIVRYGDRVLDESVIPHKALSAAERGYKTLTVRVIDTSWERSSIASLAIEAERTEISSAVGYEERNRITVTHGKMKPSVRLIGSGTLTLEKSNPASTVYLWHGIVEHALDSISVESSVSMSDNVMKFARVTIPLRGVLPLQNHQIPRVGYAGEELNCDLSVTGLNNPELYRWELREILTTGETVTKDSGRGPLMRFRIPFNYEGKRLQLLAFYEGRRYQSIDPVSYVSQESLFHFPVVKPPTRIRLALPQRVTATTPLFFSASLFNDPRFEGEQPLTDFKSINARLTRVNGRPVRTVLTMLGRGRFQLSIADKTLIEPNGERLTLHIGINEASLTQQIFITGR